MAVDALIADPSIEIVLVLTPPAAHAAVSRAAIAAGKHVYSEKPLATTRADAAAILADARPRPGVRVGAAPDTFLGGGLQTARALIDEGAIGTPLTASAAVAHLGPERWHPNPAIFYAPGGGPLLDVGPYYVAALVSLLGPIRRVAAAGRGVGSERLIGSGPRAGQTVDLGGPDHGRRHARVRVGRRRRADRVVRRRRPARRRISRSTGRPARSASATRTGSTAEVRYRPLGAEAWEDVPLRFDATVGRGVGLADLITGASGPARRSARPARFAFHVLDVLLGLEAAATSDRWEAMASTTERPAPLDLA